MSVRSAVTRFGSFAIVALFVPTIAARADDDVHISVVSVLATTKNSTVDKRVECIATEMKKVDPKLTGFSVAHVTRKDVVIGGKDSFETVDGKIVYVTAEKRCDKDKSRVCLKVEAPTLGSITYQTCCGKFVPVVTRYKTKSGDVLIIAVGVNACKDD
jgi:hypothetical protein